MHYFPENTRETEIESVFKNYYLREWELSTENKNAPCQSCELSFIWGRLRTIAQETASQIVLRNCSLEPGEEVSIHMVWGKGECVQSSTHFGRRLLLVTRSRCLR